MLRTTVLPKVWRSIPRVGGVSRRGLFSPRSIAFSSVYISYPLIYLLVYILVTGNDCIWFVSFCSYCRSIFSNVFVLVLRTDRWRGCGTHGGRKSSERGRNEAFFAGRACWGVVGFDLLSEDLGQGASMRCCCNLTATALAAVLVILWQ